MWDILRGLPLPATSGARLLQSRRPASLARVRRRLVAAIDTPDQLHTTDAADVVHRMSFAEQRHLRVPAEPGLEPERVRHPLVMKTAKGDRLAGVHAEEKHVQKRLEHTRNDAGTAGRPGHGEHARLVEHDGRRHAGEWTFVRRRQVPVRLVQPVNVRPADARREIVHRVEALFELTDAIEKRIESAGLRADKLTQSILAKAFYGELVPTEVELARQEGRSYEPAEVLLERIKTEKEKKPSSPRRGGSQ